MTVTLTLAKAHCRVTSSSEDTIITQYLNASIAYVENYTKKKLTASSSITEEYSEFHDFFTLLWGPNVSDVEIGYIDPDGGEQTIEDASFSNGKLYPPLDTEWPAIQDNSVITITYTAGYTTNPPELDNAVLLLVGEYYDNRSAGMVSSAIAAGVESLCEPYRVPTLR